jgi:hypothetical protein
VRINIPTDFWLARDKYWPREGANGCILPAFDDDVLCKCHERLGVLLPPDFIDLLRTQNGGCITYTELLLATPTLWGEDAVTVNSLPGIAAQASFYSLTNYSIDFEYPLNPDNDRIMAELKRKLGNERMLIRIGGDGHYMLALDYRDSPLSDEPPVIWMDLESDVFDFVPVAENFNQFFGMLQKPNE